MTVVASGVLVVTVGAVVARQLLRRGPPVWVLLLLGAFLTVGFGVIPLDGASLAVAQQLPILGFLFALFVFAASLEQAGALDHLATWILSRIRRSADVPLVLFVAFALLSAFLLNDALVLIGVPLLFPLARRLRVAPEPLLLTLAFAVTVGSTLTPFGNPQNLLVSLGSGLDAPVATFLRYLLVPTAINIVLGGWYLRRVFAPDLAEPGDPQLGTRPPKVPFFPASGLAGAVRRTPALALFPLTLLVLITLDVTSVATAGPAVPLYLIALGGSIVTLLVTPGRTAILARIDWPILVLFGALFVVVAGAESGGALAALESALPLPSPSDRVGSLATILVTSVLGSQLVSNVPWVGLQIPVLRAAGFGAATPWAWMALAAGSTLAGNLTLLGAASNLIVVEQAERAGVRISLARFVRIGLPLTVISVTVLFVCLLVGL